MRIIGVTQARINSSRLPRKVLLTIQGKTLLQYHLERAIKSLLVNKWIVATTEEHESDLICTIAKKYSLQSFKGKLDDVLDRFYMAVKEDNPDYVVRITSDCPLIDATVIDNVIKFAVEQNIDYVSNTLDPKFPDGIDVEVFKFSALERAWKEAKSPLDREHVTPYIWRNSSFFNKNIFISQNYSEVGDYSKYRLTVDQLEDFTLIKKLIEDLGSDGSWMEYVIHLQNKSELVNLNSLYKRNEGFMESITSHEIKLRIISNYIESDKYRDQIHQLIPGGAHTYSKGDDQFPQISPAAISHGKGAYVWDIDGNQFLDCSMGLTSVGLGHAYEPVLDLVRIELEKGVNFQRPSILEKVMAEKFLSLVPQHEMVKFAKNGSIVTTAAIKLARAKTGKKLVAFPGDHPFYSYDDWFIGKTSCSLGVPEETMKLSVTFKSGDIHSLRELFEQYPNQIACVITEPERSSLGKNQFGLSAQLFLEEAIKLTHENGALFIMDEMITGFKSSLPGSITKFNLQPDMATWGKGIANGFSFCALTGKKEIMELGGIKNLGAEKVFLISTTHGGETHALAAGIASIDEFIGQDVISHNHTIGDYFIQKCNEVLVFHELTDYVELISCNWMPVFLFRDNNKEISMGFRTLALQEMIKRGVLFQGSFIPCFSHSINDVDYFVKALNETMLVYKEALKSGYESYLIGPPTKSVFRKFL